MKLFGIMAKSDVSDVHMKILDIKTKMPERDT